MKKIVIVLIVLVLTISAMAQNTVEKQVKGTGKTRQLAINNALYEAVSQVQGVKVDSAVASAQIGIGSIEVNREETKKTIEVEGISLDTLDTINLTQAHGIVKSYNVINEQQAADGVWNVELNVLVYDYSSPLQSKQFSLIVSDFKADQQICPFGNIEIPADQLSAQLSQKLVDMLNASGKFSILDREYTQQFLKEKSITASGDTGLDEKSKLANVITADYILTGKILTAQLLEQTKMITAINQPLSEYQADLIVQSTMFVAPTRELVFTKEYRIKLDSKEVREIIDQVSQEDTDFEEVKNFLLEQTARMIVEDMLEQLCPVKIALAGNDIIIDQGGSRVIAGDVYQVFQTGEKIMAPDTNEVLGYSENFIADIKIIKILPKFSYTQIINGDANEIKVGQICRLLHPEVDYQYGPEQGRKTQVRQQPTGGIIMPFDK